MRTSSSSVSCSWKACPICRTSADSWIGEDVKEILDCDLALETMAIPALREGIAHCEQVDDYVTRHLLREILESEEEHVDWLETQFELIKRMGLENYVQLQSEPADD